MQKTSRAALSDSERLDLILSALDDLKGLCSTHVLLVEGKNDRASLESLGVVGDYFLIQSEGGPVKAVEYTESVGRPAVLLTDWDRRGDVLASTILSMFNNDTARIDLGLRKRLGALCRGYIFDVESLGSLVRTLSDKSI